MNKRYGRRGAEIFAPRDGEIVLVEDGVPERNPVSLRSGMKYMVEVTRRFKAGKASYREVAGNYIVMKCSGGFFALFARLRRGWSALAPGSESSAVCRVKK